MIKISKTTFGNHIQLIFSLIMVLSLYLISRILFFIFNTSYFPGVNTLDYLAIVFYGLRFDLASVLTINSIYIIFFIIPLQIRHNKTYLKIAKFIFILLNTVAISFNFIDIIYYRFTLKRTTFDIFRWKGLGNDLLPLIPQFLKDFWYVVIIWFLFIFFLVFLYNKTRITIKKPEKSIKYYILQSIIGFIFFVLTVIGMRGGLQNNPIRIITAARYTAAQNFPLILNTPFTIYLTLSKQKLEKKKYFNDDKLAEKIYNPIHLYKNDSIKNFKNFNVVVIILESFSKEHIGYLNKDFFKNRSYKSYTPFLDSLASESFTCMNAFANGKKSIEAIPAILSGVPSLMDNPYITSEYSRNEIHSLASLLAEKGYNSSFYHGGANGTMGFDSYCKVVGIDDYFGKDEFGNNDFYDGKWGIFDEPYLKYYANELNKKAEPFFSTVFTLSSHHPYVVPKEYEDKFPEGTLNIHQSLGYADYSLKKFFNICSKMPWFDNTLFVLTADHTSRAHHTYYRNRVGMYAVPIIFYKRNSNLRGESYNISQQIDIYPTVLNYLNYEKDYFAFGQDIFNPETEGFSVNYLNNIYQLLMDEHTLFFDGEKSIAMFNIKKDRLLLNDLISKDKKMKAKMELFLKSFIQTYNSRMIENKLTNKNIRYKNTDKKSKD